MIPSLTHGIKDLLAVSWSSGQSCGSDMALRCWDGGKGRQRHFQFDPEPGKFHIFEVLNFKKKKKIYISKGPRGARTF